LNKLWFESSETLSLPFDFAIYLSQVYGYFDASPDNDEMPGVMLQMSLFNQLVIPFTTNGSAGADRDL